jgi:PAS domain S-box-containing protein
MAWLEGVHPDDRELPLAVVNKHIGGNISETDTVEFRIVRPDGTVRWILARTYPVMDEQGRVYRITGIAEDITQRKQAEEALRESEEKFRSLSETVNAGIVLIRGDKFIYVNPVAIKDLGYTKDELLAMNFLDAIHPDSRELVRSRAIRRFRGLPEPYTYEIKVLTKSGDTLWEQLSSTVIDYKGEPTIIATIFNITKRKQAEEALKLTGYSLDNVLDIVIWFSPDGRIIYANNAACKSFGYSHDEMLSMTISDINPSYTKESWNDRWQELKSKGSSHYEDISQDKDGRQFPIDVTNTYIKYGDSELMFGYARDITERKLAEEDIKAAKAQAELYLDLMGHDINNMHQIALGYLELARDMPPGEYQVKFLDKPVEVLQRSAQLIKNVRKLQKLKDGVFQTQEIDVCEVLRDVQRELGAVPNKAITLNMNRCEQCLVRANELLHDVFANLVSNAIKHTGDNTDIVIDMDVLKDNSNKYCRVMIEDNGPGIPDNFKSVIFNRELRGTSKAKGMGLGLFLVKSLVDSYHGQVWVEDRVISDHTKGARFVVMLPIVEK